MKPADIREARTNLSQLIEKACRGEEVFIAKEADLVVRLATISRPKAIAARPKGWLSKDDADQLVQDLRFVHD